MTWEWKKAETYGLKKPRRKKQRETLNERVETTETENVKKTTKKHVLCNEWKTTMVIYIYMYMIWLLCVSIKTSIEVDKTCRFTISVPTRSVSEFMGYLALGCLGVTHAVADWRYLGISRGFEDWWNGDFTRKSDGLTWFKHKKRWFITNEKNISWIHQGLMI